MSERRKYRSDGEYADALEAQIEALKREWQPIESAPKDKRLLLFYRNVLNKPRIVIGCWYNDGELENSGGGDNPYCPAGWYECPEEVEYSQALENDPTDWQSLPDPPTMRENDG